MAHLTDRTCTCFCLFLTVITSLLSEFFFWLLLFVVADSRHSDEHQTNQNHGKSHPTEHHTSVTQINADDRCAVAQSKCPSLPNGVSVSPAPSFKLLTRSRSNATVPPSSPIYDEVAADEKEAAVAKREEGPSFFSRLLLRRSSKKKKTNVEDAEAPKDEDDDGEASAPSDGTASDPPSLDVKEESSMAYVNGGLTNAMKHHPMFRQRVEPLNLTAPEKPSRAKISYSSTVPVNMGDDAIAAALVDGKRGLQKSQSFRNNDKLPYTFCEDTTPSLPVNIGLVLKDVDGVARRFSKSDEATNEFAAYEPVNFGAESNKWRMVAPTVPEYSNVSVVNTLNINVNDQTEAPFSPVNEANMKSKPTQVSYEITFLQNLLQRFHDTPFRVAAEKQGMEFLPWRGSVKKLKRVWLIRTVVPLLKAVARERKFGSGGALTPSTPFLKPANVPYHHQLSLTTTNCPLPQPAVPYYDQLPLTTTHLSLTTNSCPLPQPAVPYYDQLPLTKTHLSLTTTNCPLPLVMCSNRLLKKID